MEVLDGDGGDWSGRSRRERGAEETAGTGMLKRFAEALIGYGVGRRSDNVRLVRLISFYHQFMYSILFSLSYYDFFFFKKKQFL